MEVVEEKERMIRKRRKEEESERKEKRSIRCARLNHEESWSAIEISF